MRPIGRIEKFFKTGVIDHMHDNGVLTNEEFHNISIRWNEIREYWEKHPDQRFFQVLINLEVIADEGNRFFKEDMDFLMDAGVYLGDLLRWKSYYDKNEEIMEKPITRYIKDLDTDHINAIFEYTDRLRKTLPKLYEYALLTELEVRDGEYTDSSNSEQESTERNSDSDGRDKVQVETGSVHV